MWQLGLMFGTLGARKMGCSWVTSLLPKYLDSLVLDSEVSWIYQIFGFVGTPVNWEAVEGENSENMVKSLKSEY
jgi:hypothetical protein